MKPKFINLFLALVPVRREAVTNSDEPREAAVSNASDVPVDEATDHWIKIAPYGVYPGSKPGRDQHFMEEEANAMVRQFQSIAGRVGRLFRGVPVYIGHPDAQPQLYTDHRRLGKITNLRAGEDGLYGEVVWNSLGEDNLKEGYWVYPSPRWDAPHGRPQFRPDRLLSVGMTNFPRIAASEPVTNSSLDNEQTTDTDDIMDRKTLCEKLGLDVTATDEEILAKIAKLQSDADSADAKMKEKETEMETASNSILTLTNDLTASRERVTTLEGELAAEREAVANGLLDAAVTDGRITEADRAGWLPRLTGEKRDEEINALGALKPVLNTQSIDVSGSRVEIGDEKQRRETISNAVDVLMRDNGMSYDDAWNAAKKDPKLKPVWDAMRTEG